MELEAVEYALGERVQECARLVEQELAECMASFLFLSLNFV